MKHHGIHFKRVIESLQKVSVFEKVEVKNVTLFRSIQGTTICTPSDSDILL